MFCVCGLCVSCVCLLQESEERRRQEAELARVQRDRGEGEEVPLGRPSEGPRGTRGRGVELRIRGDEDSEDSDDVVEEMEGESERETASFESFLKQRNT